MKETRLVLDAQPGFSTLCGGSVEPPYILYAYTPLGLMVTLQKCQVAQKKNNTNLTELLLQCVTQSEAEGIVKCREDLFYRPSNRIIVFRIQIVV